jgi:hypothetical protein
VTSPTKISNEEPGKRNVTPSYRPVVNKVRPLDLGESKKRYSSQMKRPPSRNRNDHSIVSKDSGTNVSFQSSFSAIKKDITRFKNKTPK